MGELKACPCGVTPTDLHIYSDIFVGKWAWVGGNCCGEWSIEFRTNYSDGEELQKRAREAWNEAPRAQAHTEETIDENTDETV